MSDARHERADKWRQEREKQVVMHQLQQQQERADAEAAAAADGNEEAADRQPSSLDALPEERNLVVIIKADVQVQLHAALTAGCLEACCISSRHCTGVLNIWCMQSVHSNVDTAVCNSTSSNMADGLID